MRQISLPVAFLERDPSAPRRRGAMMTPVGFDQAGTGPLYQSGIRVLYSRTRFLFHSSRPVSASRQ